MIDVFIIDDHQIFIDGVKVNLQTKKDNLIVKGSSTSIKKALKTLRKTKVDVILLDLMMPEISGIEGSLLLKKEFPDIKIVILTGENDTSLLFNAWITGVDAILTKLCGQEELIETIESVIKGNRVIGKNVPAFFNHINEGDTQNVILTRREQQILNLLAQGKKRREAAEILFISKDTVDFHCKNLYKKFNKNKIQSVIQAARKAKLIS